jgi:hypothetical protein
MVEVSDKKAKYAEIEGQRRPLNESLSAAFGVSDVRLTAFETSVSS